MMVKITFTKTGCCSAIGNFAPGDAAWVSEDMARHLVIDAECAKYAEPLPPPAEPEPKRLGRKG